MTRARPPSLGHLQLKTINYTAAPPSFPFFPSFFNSAILPICRSFSSLSLSLCFCLVRRVGGEAKSKESDVRKKTRIARLGPGMSKILEILSSGSGSAVHALYANFMNAGILFQPRESATFSCVTRFHERRFDERTIRRRFIFRRNYFEARNNFLFQKNDLSLVLIGIFKYR